jgi:hypothetical protein
VIDAVHRPVLDEPLAEQRVERDGALEVLAEGLLDGEPAARRQAGVRECPRRVREGALGQGEVGGDRLAARGAHDGGDRLGVRDVGPAVAARRGDRVARGLRHRGRVACQALGDMTPEGVVVPVARVGADQLKGRGEPAFLRMQGRQSGEQEAACEVASCSEERQPRDHGLGT